MLDDLWKETSILPLFPFPPSTDSVPVKYKVPALSSRSLFFRLIFDKFRATLLECVLLLDFFLFLFSALPFFIAA